MRDFTPNENEKVEKLLNINKNALKIKIRSLTNDLNKNDDLIVKEFVKCVIAHDNGELDIYLGISKNNGRASNWLPRYELNNIYERYIIVEILHKNISKKTA